jgi:NADH-ubiquinone oxidoreductase chain 5
LQATKSALKAIIFNRIGDFGYVSGICLLFFLFRTLDFNIVFALIPYYANFIYTVDIINISLTYTDIICLFLFLGTVGKSAQLGLHLWLPEAMEGPTPVSALIHAATLVTAGIFLLIRCSFIFEYSKFALFIVLVIGGITSLLGASTALLQNDIKKIIAFSTTSQLGYMAFSCGISTYNVAFFHLINHAFFKSLLFLSAGSIIHAMSNDQDLRKFGGLIKFLPFTYGVMVIGFLALCGFPFLSGFYSKEIIIETSYSFYSFSCNLTY